MRLTEVNSISGGGLDGASNVFAAALWTADLAFEYAKAGVQSISMHWGVGGMPDGFHSTPSYAAVRTGFGTAAEKHAFPGNSNPAVQVRCAARACVAALRGCVVVALLLPSVALEFIKPCVVCVPCVQSCVDVMMHPLCVQKKS